MELEKVIVYRITHIENIPHILKHGITHKNSPKRNPNFQNIGDSRLVDRRNSEIVHVSNGDSASNKSESITLSDYIPFYFGVRMPMLYVAQKRAHSPENIVYIACSLKSIISNKNKFYFTDGHAKSERTVFYNREKIDELVQIVDWNAVRSSDWGGEENLNLKRRKQAEFLVYGDIAPEHIAELGCFNETAKGKLISRGVPTDTIKVIPEAYYKI